MTSDLLTAGTGVFREQSRLAACGLTLAKGQTYAVALDPEAELLITVESGCLWVTVEGDSMDYAATAHAPVVVKGSGLVVLEGVETHNVGVAAVAAVYDRRSTHP
jgi:hypothetical protein